jgi:hypothetical protein
MAPINVGKLHVQSPPTHRSMRGPVFLSKFGDGRVNGMNQRITGVGLVEPADGAGTPGCLAYRGIRMSARKDTTNAQMFVDLDSRGQSLVARELWPAQVDVHDDEVRMLTLCQYQRFLARAGQPAAVEARRPQVVFAVGSDEVLIFDHEDFRRMIHRHVSLQRPVSKARTTTIVP